MFVIHFRKLVDLREARDDSNQLGPFEASGLAFGLVMSNLYDLKLHISQNGQEQNVHQVQEQTSKPTQHIYVLPLLLNEACKELTITNLPHSGWVQFYLYQTLYCSDVEKPECEEQLKRVRNY